MGGKSRLLAAVLLLPLHGVCAAQEMSLASCHEKLAAAPGFAILADKVALGAGKNTTPRMLADPSLANNTERPVIGKWAAARADCVKANSRFGNEVYRPPLQAFSMDAENKIMAVAVELYDLKISWRVQSAATSHRSRPARKNSATGPANSATRVGIRTGRPGGARTRPAATRHRRGRKAGDAGAAAGRAGGGKLSPCISSPNLCGCTAPLPTRSPHRQSKLLPFRRPDHLHKLRVSDSFSPTRARGLQDSRCGRRGGRGRECAASPHR